MNNISGTPDWIPQSKPKNKPESVEKRVEEEEYAGPNFNMGDIVKLKIKQDLGIGVVVKELPNFKYWIVFPDAQASNCSSVPWEYDIYSRQDMDLYKNN